MNRTVVSDELAQRARDEELQLIPSFTPQHVASPSPRIAGRTESGHSDFFNEVHFYRNVFSHVPATRVREVSHMLKAIHAQENRDAANRKALAIVEDLRTARMNTAADLVECRDQCSAA
jgi:hypothetical protein